MRYASKEDVQKLSKQIEQIAENLTRLAQIITVSHTWQAYETIKKQPYLYGFDERRAILDMAKEDKLLVVLFKDLFRNNPLPSLSSSTVLTQGAK